VHSALARILQLRDALSVYDAPYVALAEHLEATLVTCDGQLTRAVQGLLPLNVVGVTA
jgi:predicted nucleic acid-binding protein